MRIILAGLFLIFFVSYSFTSAAMNNSINNDAFSDELIKTSSAEKLNEEEFMDNYFKNPTPDRMPEYINTIINDPEIIGPFNGQVFIAFVAGIVKDNPEKVASWMERLKFIDEHSMERLNYIYWGIWYSGNPEAGAYLQQLAMGDDYRASLAKRIIRSPLRDLLEIEKTDPGNIDMLWASFFARGDDEYLRLLLRIAAFDPKRDLSGLYADDGLVSMAIWSIKSYREKDPVINERIANLIAKNPDFDYSINQKSN
ncbi:MAG: hypothetical protein KKE11_01500 [Gammaproteobacteria bacterium]|nr:hypothetical protein [Gammaproteobacteria bacterium]